MIYVKGCGRQWRQHATDVISSGSMKMEENEMCPCTTMAMDLFDDQNLSSQ
jgi:hypothetical protein